MCVWDYTSGDCRGQTRVPPQTHIIEDDDTDRFNRLQRPGPARLPLASFTRL